MSNQPDVWSIIQEIKDFLSQVNSESEQLEDISFQIKKEEYKNLIRDRQKLRHILRTLKKIDPDIPDK